MQARYSGQRTIKSATFILPGSWAYVSSGITVTEQIDGLGEGELLGYANDRLETAFGGSLVLSAGGNMLVTVSGTPDGAAIGSGLATLLTEQINAHTGRRKRLYKRLYGDCGSYCKRLRRCGEHNRSALCGKVVSALR